MYEKALHIAWDIVLSYRLREAGDPVPEQGFLVARIPA